MLALGLTNTKICSHDDSPVLNLFYENIENV